MSNTKHTPGPWQIVHTPLKENEWIESANPTRQMGDIICCAPYKEAIDSLIQWQANAKLIAAAPELLEACKFVHETLMQDEVSAEDVIRMISKVDSAIQKAIE